MLKNKLDFKLINLVLIMLIIFLLYQTGLLWMGITNKLLTILGPFFFAFAVAYALYPLLQYLQSKKIPKALAVLIVLILIVGIIAITGILVAPVLFNQLSSLFSGIISFLKEMAINFDLNIGSLQSSLSSTFNEIITDLGKYVSDGAINFIGVSLNVITTIFIAFSAAVYFLIDMDKIRSNVSHYLKRKSRKAYNYAKILDTEMKNYLVGFLKVIFITLVEYTLGFYIIGHPNAILLGFLAAVATCVPYFGGMFTNFIAMITAFVVSPALFLRTVIAFFVLSNIDGYVINPFVYGKTNQVPPLIVILAVFAGGILFGIMGIIISLPVAIILLATYKFYKKDFMEKLEDYKENNEKEKEKTKVKKK